MGMKGVIEAIKNKHLYDFLSVHGYSLSKDELISIALELEYGIHAYVKDDFQKHNLYGLMIESLEERWL